MPISTIIHLTVNTQPMTNAISSDTTHTLLMAAVELYGCHVTAATVIRSSQWSADQHTSLASTRSVCFTPTTRSHMAVAVVHCTSLPPFPDAMSVCHHFRYLHTPCTSAMYVQCNSALHPIASSVGCVSSYSVVPSMPVYCTQLYHYMHSLSSRAPPLCYQPLDQHKLLQ